MVIVNSSESASSLVQETWVAVADGEKAIVFENIDTDDHPILNVLRKEEIENSARREQAANRRGRMHDGPQGHHRSAVEDTDWHELGKERFNKDFAERLNKAALNNAFDRLVVIAPPQTLGRLRPEFHQELEKRILIEDASDLTNHPVDQIEAHVARLIGAEDENFEADLRRSS